MLEKMKELIVDELGVETDKITEATSFKKDLGADSLDLFQLVMRFEEEFGVEIPSEELENMDTVGDVMAYIEKK
ncbi:acyl carrier protein [Lachnospiraceae bacterium KM106-2]|nr:acyl carrier protein [Lachnospiraceae bacterium KM106-2]